MPFHRLECRKEPSRSGAYIASRRAWVSGAHRRISRLDPLSERRAKRLRSDMPVRCRLSWSCDEEIARSTLAGADRAVDVPGEAF